MKSLTTITAVAIALVAGGVAANAADSAKTPPYAAPVIADANAMKGADDMHSMSIRQQLQDQLTKAGYTSVQITPSSFFVQAKDKKGDSVAMVIGPDSFTEVTTVPGKTADAKAPQAPKANTTQK